MRIAAGSDHAGLQLKDALVEYLTSQGHQVTDLGTTTNDRVDYPDYGAAVASAVVDGSHTLGLAVCGSGLGIAMAANKVAGGRAAPCHDVTSARLARLHNDANVICFGERLIGISVAKESLEAFIATGFEGGRHTVRIEKLGQLDTQLG